PDGRRSRIGRAGAGGRPHDLVLPLPTVADREAVMTHPFGWILAVITATVLMLVGCASAAQPTLALATSASTSISRGPVTRGPHPSLTTQNPDAAAVAAARALASSDTAVDA